MDDDQIPILDIRCHRRRRNSTNLDSPHLLLPSAARIQVRGFLQAGWQARQEGSYRDIQITQK